MGGFQLACSLPCQFQRWQQQQQQQQQSRLVVEVTSIGTPEIVQAKTTERHHSKHNNVREYKMPDPSWGPAQSAVGCDSLPPTSPLLITHQHDMYNTYRLQSTPTVPRTMQSAAKRPSRAPHPLFHLLSSLFCALPRALIHPLSGYNNQVPTPDTKENASG